MTNVEERHEGARESLEGLCLFMVPILVVIPLYVFEVLQDIQLAYYMIYSTYIAGSIFIVRHNQRKLSEIGLTGKSLSESLLLAVGFVAAFIVVQAVQSEMQLSTDLTPVLIIEQLVFSFAFSGLGQELLFRGVLLFSLWRWKGWEIGVVTTSILFGLVHLLKGVRYVAATIVIGLFYGYVAYRTRNIVGPIVAHGFNNFILGFILIA